MKNVMENFDSDQVLLTDFEKREAATTVYVGMEES